MGHLKSVNMLDASERSDTGLPFLYFQTKASYCARLISEMFHDSDRLPAGCIQEKR